ncbi:ATP synthase F1, epsilon subunit [Segniliparus rotundus DSM 44985]|uniref:ATP synthase epsilon chain n=1 Tax=Segniliparus rotundus (strain ATCC BAA-972 / CDC 1076 / CIP 108378 / DSM 44985 / JCM 13578) TaxID=640132 RepID=D6ZDB9_SEGRD|nr:F0F1 ATP synthase subunit epsilon [Segniliparus rotundus]ADG97183.1 ATP synthase F1, epsilon subunit [Segniliparus rotundus DSM 44985]
MSEFTVELISVEEKFWNGPAVEVLARTTVGEIGVLPGHIPVFGQLAEGFTVTIVDPEGERHVAAVDGGFISVTPTLVTILAEGAQWANDVDIAAQESVLAAEPEGTPAYLRAQARLSAKELAV